MSRATLYQAKNISRQDYEFEGLDIGPDWQSNVLDTIPLVLMMREMGISFKGFQDDMMVSERRDEYECKDTDEDDIMFAVKTCEKFHKTRISVIKNTWGKYVKDLTIYSDKNDDDIPTVKLPNWVEPRVKKYFGCNKTLSILKHFLEEKTEHTWLVLVDDDTILSVARVKSMISCYRDQKDPVILGMFHKCKIL